MQNGKQRNGISLFEVLVSILVAAIGVFGAILLIPFAWETAERGIDHETGINVAKNYSADFNAYGFSTAADTWYDDTPFDGLGNMPDPDPHVPSLAAPFTRLVNRHGNESTIIAGWPYVIDTIGSSILAGQGNPYGQFPEFGGWIPPVDLPTLNRISLLDQAATDEDSLPDPLRIPLSLELANRLSLGADDLTFKSSDDGLSPPRQAYFEMNPRDSGGTIVKIPDVKRQYRGTYKTVSFMIPEDDEGLQYRMIILVIKKADREEDQNRIFEIVDPADPTARISKTDTPTSAPDMVRQFEQIGLGGGDLMLSELGTPKTPDTSDDAIRNNDWMMLVSYYEDPTEAVAVDFNNVSLGFFRVIHGSRVSLNGGRTVRDPLGERTYSVTLQGADFDLARDWSSLPDAPPSTPTTVATYAVLIPNVLVVYERTIRAEADSTWN